MKFLTRVFLGEVAWPLLLFGNGPTSEVEMAVSIFRNEHNSMFYLERTSVDYNRWMLAMGIALMVLGAVGMVAAVTTTLLSVFFLGFMCLLGAIFQIVFAGTAGRWTGFGLHLLLGVLYGVSGAFLLMNPTIGAAGLTLLLAVFFILSGAFRLVGSAMMRFAGWGWPFVSGVITTGLGIFVLLNLPVASLFLLGLLLSIDLMFFGLMFFGATLTSFGLALRSESSSGLRL